MTPQEFNYQQKLIAHVEAVKEAGRRLGVPEVQLAVHDASKWSKEEFGAYAEYFSEGRDESPVDTQQAISDRFAQAWLHHIHWNEHHWQHWMFADGWSPKNSQVENGVLRMPENFALEMIADWMGASYVYTGSWNMSAWLRTNVPRIRLHSLTARYVTDELLQLGYEETFQRVQFNVRGSNEG